MVREAVESAGGTLLQGYQWDTLPPTATDPCGTGVQWLNYFGNEELLLGATFSVGRRWAQSVTERYSLSVEIPDSITAAGEVIERIGSAFEVESPAAEAWGSEPFTDGISSHTDVRDQVRRDAFLQVLLRQGVATVVNAHRETVLTFQVPTSMALGIDLVHTVLLEDQGARALGKVIRVSDDLTEPLPLTTISLKVMRGGGTVTDPLTPPASVNEPQPWPSTTVELPTQLGGRTSSPPYDDTLPGFAGNFSTGSGEQFPRRFELEASEIPAELRDELPVTIEAAYRVAIPNDLLEL